MLGPSIPEFVTDHGFPSIHDGFTRIDVRYVMDSLCPELEPLSDVCQLDPWVGQLLKKYLCSLDSLAPMSLWIDQ